MLKEIKSCSVSQYIKTTRRHIWKVEQNLPRTIVRWWNRQLLGQVRAYDNNFKKDLSYLFWHNKRTGYTFPSVTVRVFYGIIIQLLRKHNFFCRRTFRVEILRKTKALFPNSSNQIKCLIVFVKRGEKRNDQCSLCCLSWTCVWTLQRYLVISFRGQIVPQNSQFVTSKSEFSI